MSLKTSAWKNFFKVVFTNALEFIVVKKHISKNFAGSYKFLSTTCGSREAMWVH